MKNRHKRLKVIELSLTPKQIVAVWLKNAIGAATYLETGRRSPPPRGTIANKVLNVVQNSMKGQADALVERAVLQGRQEADLLYQLIVNANMAVLESRPQREREYIFLLLACIGIATKGEISKERVENLRSAILMFIEPILILDGAIAGVVSEHLDGQPVLFRDCAVELREQLQMGEKLSEQFNRLARALKIDKLDLVQLHCNLQSEIDRRLSNWARLGHIEMLNIFGSVEQMYASMDQLYSRFEGESNSLWPLV
jgi:hypothetical protein